MFIVWMMIAILGKNWTNISSLWGAFRTEDIATVRRWLQSGINRSMPGLPFALTNSQGLQWWALKTIELRSSEMKGSHNRKLLRQGIQFAFSLFVTKQFLTFNLSLISFWFALKCFRKREWKHWKWFWMNCKYWVLMTFSYISKPFSLKWFSNFNFHGL